MILALLVWLLAGLHIPGRQLRTLPQVLEERPWLTERFLRRLVEQKRVPYFKVRNRVLFDLADLDDLAEQGRVEPPAELQTVGRRRPDRART